MPLKQPYGKPPVPPRKESISTRVKKSSKADAAFVKSKMDE